MKRAVKNKNDKIAKKMEEWKKRDLNVPLEETKAQIATIKNLDEFEIVSKASSIA